MDEDRKLNKIEEFGRSMWQHHEVVLEDLFRFVYSVRHLWVLVFLFIPLCILITNSVTLYRVGWFLHKKEFKGRIDIGV